MNDDNDFLHSLRVEPGEAPPRPLDSVIQRGSTIRTRRRALFGLVAVGVAAAAIAIGAALNDDEGTIEVQELETPKTEVPDSRDPRVGPPGEVAPTLGTDGGSSESGEGGPTRVVFPAGGVVEDPGSILPAGAAPMEGVNAITRTADGTLWFVDSTGRIHSRGVDGESWATRDDAETYLSIARSSDGSVAVATTATGISIDMSSGETVENPVTPERIVAANGLVAELIEPDVEREELSEADPPSVTRVNAGGAVRVLDEGGAVVASFPYGGSAAFVVDLNDFDGRRLMMSRGPEEPAQPLWEYVVVDLECPECTETFDAFAGTAALYGSDVAEPPAVVAEQLGLCASWTDDEQPDPADMPPLLADAFHQLALGVARCDADQLRRSGLDPVSVDGAGWRAVAAALAGPSSQEDDSLVWEGSAGGREARVEMDLVAATTITLTDAPVPDPINVEYVEGGAVAWGEAPQDDIDRLAEAVESLKDPEVFYLAPRLNADATAGSHAGLDALIALVTEGLSRPEVAEASVQLDGSRITVWASIDGDADEFSFDEGEVGEALDAAAIDFSETIESPALTDTDRQMADALIEFAKGDDSAFDRVGFAPAVRLTLGSDIAEPTEGIEPGVRSQWSIDAEGFRAYVGPFSALELLADAGATTVDLGPHPHCATSPVPPPPSLAGLRRVSIQPEPDSIDSCNSWFTVDVYVDAEGFVLAVGLDLYEP